MNDAFSETRNATALAISIGFPSRPYVGESCSASSSSSIGVSTGPGNTALTRMPGSEFGGGDLGQSAQRPFRRAVGGVVRERPNGPGAARVDDGGTLGPPQVFQRRLNSQERPKTVEPPTAFEAVRRLIVQRSPMQHPGVVDQRGQRAEPVDHVRHRCSHSSRRRHVELDGDGTVAQARPRPSSVHRAGRHTRPPGSRPRAIASTIAAPCPRAAPVTRATRSDVTAPP